MAIEKEWAKVCMGKDIHITFPVTTNGADTSLEGRDLKVVLKDSSGRVYHPTFEIDGNKISFWFYGKDHKHLGVHSIRLWENFGKVGQCPLDFTHAFELVATTDEETGPEDDEEEDDTTSDDSSSETTE